MKPLAAIGMLLLVAGAWSAQTDSDRLGYTRDQILAMGSDKWLDLYAEKKGEGAPAITVACRVYTDALHERNEERLTRMKHKSRLEAWYHAVKEYGRQTFNIQARDGGSMWVPVYAAQELDIEALLDRLIDLEIKPDRTNPPDLKACGQRVLAHHDKIKSRLGEIDLKPPEGIGRREVDEDNEKARNILERLIPSLIRTGGQEAYAVFVTCSRLSDPEIMFAPGNAQ